MKHHYNFSITRLCLFVLLFCIVTSSPQSSVLVKQDAPQERESVLVITVDGTLHSLDATTGEEKWSLNTGKPLFASTSSVTNIQPDDPVLIPSLDGSGEIYMYFQDGRIEKLSPTIYDIVSSSPLFAPLLAPPDESTGRKSDTLFIGSKTSSVFAIDPASGRLIKVMSNHEDLAFREEDGSFEDCPAGLPSGTLLIGRADYHVRAIDPLSGKERWNMTVGEYIPYMAESPIAIDNGMGTPELVSTIGEESHWLHKINHDNPNSPLWSTPVSFEPVVCYSLAQTLRKVKFVQALPKQLGSDNSQDPMVYLGSYGKQLFAISNPSIVRDLPLKLLPGEATEPGTGLVPVSGACNEYSPNYPGCLMGLYPVISDRAVVPVPSKNTSQSQSPPESLLDYFTDPRNSFWVWTLAASVLFLVVFSLGIIARDVFVRLRSSTVADSKATVLEQVPESAPVQETATVEVQAEKDTPKKTVATPKKKSRRGKTHNHDSDPNDSAEQEEATASVEEVELKKETPMRKGRKHRNREEETNGAELFKGKKNGNNADVTPKDPEIQSVPDRTNTARATTKASADGITRIGKLEISQTILGYGSSGTIVFEGTLSGRKVAVKRMLAQFVDLAQQEVGLLIHSDEHPNVVRYYAKEEDGEFIYLVLSFCTITLQHLVEGPENLKHITVEKDKGLVGFMRDFYKKKPDLQVASEIMRILRELVTGVAHLHSLNIVHRDIKPQNILLDPANRVKISDMGLAKRLEIDQSSFSGRDAGSVGWQAAEILNGSNTVRLTKAVDVFALGCVIFYTLTRGHPFGDKFEREVRILKGKSDLQAVNRWPEAHDLIKSMIAHKIEERIPAREVIHHPFFWTVAQKMHFLIQASDYLEFEPATAESVVCMDSYIKEVVPAGDWIAKLDPLLVENLGKYRKYLFKSV